ncbi:MAG: NAD(P)H-binding protein [bacterium]|nr:NAD(P)H-binding protein [bacterium]
MNKTAIVFGATGLVGGCLVEELTQHPNYKKIKIFGRRESGFTHAKIEENILNFDAVKESAKKITGDDIYICLGTTIKKAGSIEKMEQIDRHLPVVIAAIAAKNKVKNIAVISSIGADSTSGNSYLRIKGSMENDIRSLDFENIAIVRPSMLLGDRKESRFKEDIGKFFIKLLGFLLMGSLKKYRGIHGRTVARAMIHILNEKSKEEIYLSDKLQEFGK